MPEAGVWPGARPAGHRRRAWRRGRQLHRRWGLMPHSAAIPSMPRNDTAAEAQRPVRYHCPSPWPPSPAVVAPAADLGSIHRFLRHRRLLGVHRAVDPGLSGLVEAQLGLPLDKALQCSAWGEVRHSAAVALAMLPAPAAVHSPGLGVCQQLTAAARPPALPCPALQRPLSEGQQQYAAADAACLLGLLGSLIAAVGQPEEWPMAEPAAAAEEAAEEAAAPGAEDCVAAAEAAAEEAEAEEAGTPAAGPSGSGSQGRGGGPAAPPAAAVPPQEPGADALLGGCSVQQLQAAAEAWGVRLEISGARAVRRGGRRGQRQRLKKRQGQGLREPDTTGALPLHIPWLDAQRQVGGGLTSGCSLLAADRCTSPRANQSAPSRTGCPPLSLLAAAAGRRAPLSV